MEYTKLEVPYRGIMAMAQSILPSCSMVATLMEVTSTSSSGSPPL